MTKTVYGRQVTVNNYEHETIDKKHLYEVGDTVYYRAESGADVIFPKKDELEKLILKFGEDRVYNILQKYASAYFTEDLKGVGLSDTGVYIKNLVGVLMSPDLMASEEGVFIKGSLINNVKDISKSILFGIYKDLNL